MKNFWWWVIGIIIVIIIAIFAFHSMSNGGTAPSNNAADESAVRSVVSGFGNNLKMVSLLAATSTAASAIDANYAAYVDPTLLAAWESDPSQAPGRLTSSPSPDRIDIASVTLNADGTYAVDGTVVETTSADASSTAGAGSYPVTITLANESGAWKITSFEGYPPLQQQTQASASTTE